MDFSRRYTGGHPKGLTCMQAPTLFISRFAITVSLMKLHTECLAKLYLKKAQSRNTKGNKIIILIPDLTLGVFRPFSTDGAAVASARLQAAPAVLLNLTVSLYLAQSTVCMYHV